MVKTLFEIHWFVSKHFSPSQSNPTVTQSKNPSIYQFVFHVFFSSLCTEMLLSFTLQFFWFCLFCIYLKTFISLLHFISMWFHLSFKVLHKIFPWAWSKVYNGKKREVLKMLSVVTSKEFLIISRQSVSFF